MSKYRVIKRDKSIAAYDPDKIYKAIYKAAISLKEDKETSLEIANIITESVKKVLFNLWEKDLSVNVEQIQDIVENKLMEYCYYDIAKKYIKYRLQHKKIRNLGKEEEKTFNIIDDYIDLNDWKVKENSNMGYSLQGLNNHISSEATKRYWLNEIFSEEIKEAHLNGDIHLHDLGQLSAYCTGWDLEDLLKEGFSGDTKKIESAPAKHFDTALMQIVNFLYTVQGEIAGAVAFSSFDTYLAPFVAYDELDYKQVKQDMQQFIYNMNVPTRVGFQCLSEDTEILTEDGWKFYDEIKIGDTIKNFNLETKEVEKQKVVKFFSREYEGKMYNLKNRVQDQLISPNHRVVRKKFNSDKYILEPIEKVKKLKSSPIVPLQTKGYLTGEYSEEDIKKAKLTAWIIAEGTSDKHGRGTGRISIYKSEKINKDEYEDILSLIDYFDLNYSVSYNDHTLGETVNQIRFNAESSRKLYKEFFDNTDKHKGIKFIPKWILNADKKIAEEFIETYIRADGHEEVKICTTHEEIKDGLVELITNSGKASTVRVEKPTFNKLSKKDKYIIRILKSKQSYIQKINEVDYKGIIWCPTTKNETVIARRNGKVFITGNSPFSNITLDLAVNPALAKQPVIIGGEYKDKTYGDFQKEMNMINRAYAEIMLKGDRKNKVFPFPIPTYNVTNDFPWDEEYLNPVWEMTAKYGLPYFSNFISSDMDPSDIRSINFLVALNSNV